MTNTLLVGSSAGMLSVARKLKGYGHKLYVLGGISDDPCHLLADQSLIVNYLDLKNALMPLEIYRLILLCLVRMT